MSRDKQIVEMTRIAYETEIFDESDVKIAVDEGLLDTLLNLYNAGYRKASEVAREIFNTLRVLGHIDFDGNICIRKDSFEEVEKKYTEVNNGYTKSAQTH